MLWKGRIGIIVIGLVYLMFWAGFQRWPEAFRGGDAWGYYAHLPATFIYHDVGDYTATIAATLNVWPGENLSTLPTPTGRQSIKYPLGVAIMLAPFFLLAHGFTLLSGAYPADGFSLPYALAVGLGVQLYVLAGFFLLYRVLIRYFSNTVTLLTIATLALATNLFYFATYNNLMSHAPLFSWYAVLLFALVRFEAKPGYGRAALLGMAVGMIMLCRPHEAIVVLVPLFWSVWNISTLKKRIAFLRENIRFVLLAVTLAFLCFFPQLAYYKFVSGAWVYFAYTGESFNFAHPRILDGLFHFSNGWLVYTPVMVLGLVGFVRLPKHVPAAVVPLLFFLGVHVYITYSWWCWNYINGFGSRPMVETYPLLALPLAAFFAWGSQYRWKAVLNLLLLSGFAYLNVFQTWQLYKGILWTESANKAYYMAVFGTLRPGLDAVVAFDSGERQPSGQMTSVRPLGSDLLEDSTSTGATNALQHSGRFSIWAAESEFSAHIQSEPLPDIQAGDYIQATVWAFVKGNEINYNRDQLAQLIVEMVNPDQAVIKRSGIRISSKVGNPDNSIWNTGGSELWGPASFFVKVPRSVQPGAVVRAYVWNPARQKIFIDDISMTLYR